MIDKSGKTDVDKVEQASANGSLTTEEEIERLKKERGNAKGILENPDNFVLKYFRDPIHDLIKIENRIFLEILDTTPMQRLRRIKQLGTASFVFPGADHSRFSHSLGAYHLSGRMLDQLEISDTYDRFIIQLAALLHDVGHGPFSHLFETVLEKSNYKDKKTRDHESWTKKIIKENIAITTILQKYGNTIINDVHDVINKTYTPENLSSIVSSQFDVDRLDYMLRDSHMTGVKYGNFDLNWLFRCLKLKTIKQLNEDNREPIDVKTIVVDKKKGLSCIEEYLLGNLYLYKHVYFHKTVKAVDSMIIGLLLCAIKLIKNNKDIGIDNVVLSKIAFNEDLTVEEYLSLDDNVVWSWIQHWANNEVDSDLSKIAQGLISRELFKVISIQELSRAKQRKVTINIESFLNSKNCNSKYYFNEIEIDREAYKNRVETEQIYVFNDKGEAEKLKDLDENIINAITKFSDVTDYLIAFPSKYKLDIENIITEVSNG